LITQLRLTQPANGTATSLAGAKAVAGRIGYPIVLRPSYVLGGRAMEIIFDDSSLEAYVQRAFEASPNLPVLIDKFLEDAVEVNPSALRTIRYVSKVIGVRLAKLAARVMAGKTLHELGFTQEVVIPHRAVKEAVFPFLKFPSVDTVLGPEMKSTGEVMGLDT